MEAYMDPEALPREEGETPALREEELELARSRWEQEKQEEAHRLRKEREELTQQRAAFQAQLRQAAVAQALQERGLDPAFAPWLGGETEEEDRERVEDFARLFQSALTRAVVRRMRGEAPPRAPEEAPGLDRERLRAMSPAEINRQWGEVSALLRGN